ncbi:MAG TPA: hypothetical protein VKS01_08280, partial [Bryobacteraceae bacterium]|nr:hypothetical protein [Bryobacteraceae bacterium]
MRFLKYRISILLIVLAAAAECAWPQADFYKIKTEYQAVTAELQKHTQWGWLRDDDPASVRLLARQWELAGVWVAAWLNEHEPATLDDVSAALSNLGAENPAALVLDSASFLVASPGSPGNVFIVAKSNGHYHVAWSAAQRQMSVASGRADEDQLISAWLPENATGPKPDSDDWKNAGPVIPSLALLPPDSTGRARFYIEGNYAWTQGGTYPDQISVWQWDGKTAGPLMAIAYEVSLDQKMGVRVEGDVLKVEEKREFRTFYSCGMCEGRQVDMSFHLGAQGIEPAEETVATPELDAIDELFDRLMYEKDAKDIASGDAIQFADQLIADIDDNDAEHPS